MILRGYIYWVQLDPTVGAEIQKTRPALVVSNNTGNSVGRTVTVIPLTSNITTIKPFEVLLKAGSGGLKADSKAKANQIRTVDKSRLSATPLGPSLSEFVMNKVAQSIKIHLDIT